MTTLSIPISPELEKFVTGMVEQGHAANKADVVRKALKKLSEDEAVTAVLQAEQEWREGKILRGDLDSLAKKIKRS